MPKTIHHLIAYSCLFLSLACSPKETVPKELQGKWSVKGGDNERSWYIEYTIDGNSYTMQGYPPISAKGKIQLIEKQGNRYHLALKERLFHGKPVEDKKMWVKMQPKGTHLQWESHSLQKHKSIDKK